CALRIYVCARTCVCVCVSACVGVYVCVCRDPEGTCLFGLGALLVSSVCVIMRRLAMMASGLEMDKPLMDRLQGWDDKVCLLYTPFVCVFCVCLCVCVCERE